MRCDRSSEDNNYNDDDTRTRIKISARLDKHSNTKRPYGQLPQLNGFIQVDLAAETVCYVSSSLLIPGSGAYLRP